jgi:uncharacterized protein with GYD domain
VLVEGAPRRGAMTGSTQALGGKNERMITISLCRFKRKPTKESVAQTSKHFEQMAKDKEGPKVLGMYWTLGRYDVVLIMEGKDEKEAMRGLLPWADTYSTETLVALRREEAIKLLE